MKKTRLGELGDGVDVITCVFGSGPSQLFLDGTVKEGTLLRLLSHCTTKVKEVDAVMVTSMEVAVNSNTASDGNEDQETAAKPRGEEAAPADETPGSKVRVMEEKDANRSPIAVKISTNTSPKTEASMPSKPVSASKENSTPASRCKNLTRRACSVEFMWKIDTFHSS